MSLNLLLLLFLAATLHAGWNLALKRQPARQEVVWLALVLTSLLAIPLIVIRQTIGWTGLGLAAISAGVEATYYRALMAAYDDGEFSMVYPVARGAAPALIAIWAWLFLGERPTPWGWAGVSLVVAGLVLVATGDGGRAGSWRGISAGGTRLALAVAVLISVYSVFDGFAIKRVDPVSYTLTMFVLTTIVLSPFVWRRHGAAGVGRAWRDAAPTIVMVGVMQGVAYVVVLWVYARTQVTYAGAVREVSIVIGALAGWLWLGEGFGLRRVMGACTMFAGIMLIALSG